MELKPGMMDALAGLACLFLSGWRAGSGDALVSILLFMGFIGFMLRSNVDEEW